MEKLLNSAEVAGFLRISDKALLRLRTQGTIRYVALGERMIRYRIEDCEEFIANRLKTDRPSTSRMRLRSRQAVRIVGFTERRQARLSQSESAAGRTPAGRSTQ